MFNLLKMEMFLKKMKTGSRRPIGSLQFAVGKDSMSDKRFVLNVYRERDDILGTPLMSESEDRNPKSEARKEGRLTGKVELKRRITGDGCRGKGFVIFYIELKNDMLSHQFI